MVWERDKEKRRVKAHENMKLVVGLAYLFKQTIVIKYSSKQNIHVPRWNSLSVSFSAILQVPSLSIFLNISQGSHL